MSDTDWTPDHIKRLRSARGQTQAAFGLDLCDVEVQLSGELDYDPDAEWTECEPPESETDGRSFDLDDDKINEAEKQAEEINELLGF